MKEFPDEINPHLFFKQKYSSFEKYINYLKKKKNSNSKLNIFFFNFNFEEFYNPFEIILKNSSQKNDLIFYLPLSITYFFLNCNKIVQYYLAYKIIDFLFKKKLKKKKFINLDIFLEILKNEIKDCNLQKIKIIPRKSIFHRSLKQNNGDGNDIFLNDQIFSKKKILSETKNNNKNNIYLSQNIFSKKKILNKIKNQKNQNEDIFFNNNQKILNKDDFNLIKNQNKDNIYFPKKKILSEIKNEENEKIDNINLSKNNDNNSSQNIFGNSSQNILAKKKKKF